MVPWQVAWQQGRHGAAAAGPGAGGSGGGTPPIVPLCNKSILRHPAAPQILLCSRIRAGSGRLAE